MEVQTITFRMEAARVKDIDSLAIAQKRDRTALLKDAVDAYLQAHLDKSKVPVRGFGIWKDRARKEDGLAYQERMRAEWEGR
jgi:hypothetical protein